MESQPQITNTTEVEQRLKKDRGTITSLEEKVKSKTQLIEKAQTEIEEHQRDIEQTREQVKDDQKTVFEANLKLTKQNIKNEINSFKKKMKEEFGIDVPQMTTDLKTSDELTKEIQDLLPEKVDHQALHLKADKFLRDIFRSDD
eukprot:UN33379